MLNTSELFHAQLNNTEPCIQLMLECDRKWSIQLCSNSDGTSQCTVKLHTNQYLSFMKMVPPTLHSTDSANVFRGLYPVHTMAWFQFSYERNRTHWAGTILISVCTTWCICAVTTRLNLNSASSQQQQTRVMFSLRALSEQHHCLQHPSFVGHFHHRLPFQYCNHVIAIDCSELRVIETSRKSETAENIPSMNTQGNRNGSTCIV